MSKVEIRSSTVAHGHGLAELALGPETVEDNTIDSNDKNLDDDFDDAADKCPVLVHC